ncbi:hypothetical protein lerEdw1_009741 [Lerista edwardsae]|nr:hypothetical protein lerEdw1_009741 [Lerista edwardsae]
MQTEKHIHELLSYYSNTAPEPAAGQVSLTGQAPYKGLAEAPAGRLSLPAMELGGALSILLAICLSCLALTAAWRRMHRGGKLPPGPTPLPFLGNLLQVSTSETFKSFLALRDKYGPVFTVYLGPRRVVVLCGHQAVKEALVDQAEEFSGRGELASLDRNFRGFGVAFANGERWRQLRRFSLTTLRNFGMGKRSIEERIQEEAQFLLEEFRKTRGLPFDPTFFLSRTVSNVISSVVFGSRFDYEDKTFLSLLRMINESFIEMSMPWAQLYDMYSALMQYLPGRHNRLYRLIEELKTFVAEKVKVNQATLDPNSPRDFIDCFLIQMEKEKANPSSEFNLQNLVLTTLNLFFAGTETVSSTLRYGFLLLLKHPEAQERVHQEIDQVIGPNRIPTSEDRMKMPFTDAVIHEVQRLTDIVPLGLPHTVIRDTQFRGYTLPKGTNIFPLLGSVLRDPEYFSSPERFNPGHFLDEKGRFKKNEAFVPFSSGKRICLGEAMARMELFLYFTTTLQSFHLKSLVPAEHIDVSPQLQAEERREPLKSKSNEELPGDPKVTRKKKVRGGHEQEALPEKMGAVSLRTPAASPLQRAVPISESLLEELSQALLRLDMGLEQGYAYDIFSSLVQKQACYTFRASDLSQAVTAKKHALVVDWLMQVNECVGLDESPLHLAVYLLNSCLRASRVRVRAPQLRLLSAACLFLACKVEESIILPAAELCDVANDKFTPEELLRMERKILSCLKFELHYANPVPLLCLLAEVGRCTLEVQHLAMYFLELSLLEVDCLCFEPAQLALAALCLAQRVLRGAGSGGQEASPRLLTYSEAELATVHPFMARAALRGDDSALGATFRKYSKPRKLGVSSNPAVLASEYLQRCLGSPTQ